MTKEQFEASDEFKAYVALYAKWEAGEVTIAEVNKAQDTLAQLLAVNGPRFINR